MKLLEHMKMKLKIGYISLVTLLFGNTVLANDTPLVPTYPSIPPSYERLIPNKLIKRAQAYFPAYVVRNTNGYRVTTPEGNEMIVDNIAKPNCAFYATYVSTDNNGFLSLESSTKVISNVYIGEVNFDNCK